MKLDVHLKSSTWYRSKNIYVSGFIIENGEIYTEDRLCKRIAKYIHNQEQTISGEFAAIKIQENQIHLLVDAIRSQPLFYKVEGEFVTISDECYPLRVGQKASLYRDAAKTFLHSGYTHGTSTLNQNVFQVEAGTVVEIHSDGRNIIDYINSGKIVLRKKGSEDLINVLSKVFDDYINILNGRQVAISLSGGYDSRLLLAMLHLKKYDNITTFSYGRPTSIELRNAETVTQKLGYPWQYINYDTVFNPKLLSNNSFGEYCRYASNDISMFFLKQYFPAAYLSQNSLLHPDAVIVAGHTGDMIAGSHLRPFMSSEKYNEETFLDHLLKLHFNSFKRKPELHTIISESIAIPETEFHWLKYESWERVNRQAKFIVNSNRAFNFFGYSTLVPLWDRRIIEFFKCLPFDQKQHCKLYRHTLKELIFKPLGIHMTYETQPSSAVLLKQKIKDQLKRVIPKSITNQFVNYSDPYYYQAAIKLLGDSGFDFVMPRQKNIWNAYLVQWYLHKEYKLNHEDIKRILYA